jgi:hypothetical protein
MPQGYGDINPANWDERNYVILMTFVGSAISAVIINELALMASKKGAVHRLLLLLHALV